MLTEAEPNPAHLALAELERLGFVEAVVTQNIDLLHERAGSREVVEVHGSIRTATCPGCGERLAAASGARAAGRRPTRRAAPPAAQILKPDVVFFGELLPAAAIERAYRARAPARGCCSSSARRSRSTRSPGCPSETLAARRAARDRQQGPDAVRRRAALRIDGSAGEVLAQTVEALRGEQPQQPQHAS